MEIIEHYGKAIIALGAIAAAITILIFVAKKISNKTTSAVNGIDYEDTINKAASEGIVNGETK